MIDTPYSIQFLRRAFSVVLSTTTLSTTICMSGLMTLTVTLLASPSPAQFTNTQGKTVIIPAGTSFEGRMDTTISSKHSRQGDRFNVILSSPVLANGSEVVIPAGSQIVGEVVEALSSGQQPHEKKQHLNGKLRTQLTALRTPDGITYPLIASFIGETTGKGQGARPNPNLGTGVAYIGSQQNFNAVYPNARGGGNRGVQLVTKKQMMDDPLYGDPDRNGQNGQQRATMRSIVKDHRELIIHEGSPMSVRLDAPLKMAITPVGGMAPSAFSDNSQGAAVAPQAPARPTFSRPRSAIAAPPSAAAEAPRQTPQAAPPAAAAAPPVAAPQPSGFPSFLDPAPGSKPLTAVPQFTTPPVFSAPAAAPAFSAPSAPASTPSSFSPPATPAEQAAAIPKNNPFAGAAAPVSQAASPGSLGSLGSFSAAPAQAAPMAQSLGSFTAAPPAGAAAAQSLGSLNAAPSAGQAAAAQSLFGDAAAAAGPAKSLSAQGAAAAPAQGLSATPATSTFTAPAAASMTAPLVAPVVAPAIPAVAPPPPGQSLDSFINSLAHPAAAAPPAAAPAVAAPALGAPLQATPAAAPAQAPMTFSQPGLTPAAVAPSAATPAAPTFAPPRAVQAPSAPKTAPGDNF